MAAEVPVAEPEFDGFPAISSDLSSTVDPPRIARDRAPILAE